MFGLDPGLTTVLIICLIAACAFEFINGFHDTANAVATVIYTNSLKPSVAVVWSGIWNFIGVYFGGIAVAMGIVYLLPTAILVDQNISHSVSMILSLILTAILWNLGTWYFGIPCSSSHTLLGSIFGVGIAYGLLPEAGAIALNWSKVKDVAITLLISPLFGFGVTFGLVAILKKYVKNKTLFSEPKKKKPPVWWIRSVLILTCTSVSFTHGSNDGQKGVGLVMIILIGLIPTHFALNHAKNPQDLLSHINKVEVSLISINKDSISDQDKASLLLVSEKIDDIQTQIPEKATSFNNLAHKAAFDVRTDLILISKEIQQIIKQQPGEPKVQLGQAQIALIDSEVKKAKDFTDYAPWWVILMVSFSLGIGTMVGWKRIVVTIGERIGKEHLSYAQGASAELVAASTIGVSSLLGMPVSTTHVLSSGIAGSMVATNGLKNLRMKTVRSILIAWLVTLPVTIIVSGGLFLLIRSFL
jgi:PiT family inorganic phosphate transporter